MDGYYQERQVREVPEVRADNLLCIFDFHLNVTLMPSNRRMPHLTHHKKVRNGAKQDQSEIQDVIRGDIEQKDCRQPDDRKQTAKQHEPDVTFVHLYSFFSIIAHEVRRVVRQIAVSCDRQFCLHEYK